MARQEASPNLHHIGQRLSYDGALCTVRYVGAVAGTTGSWLGVEWDDPSRGKHAGEHKGVRYFLCLSRSPVAASFVRPSRPAEPALSLLEALRDKYRLWDEELQSQARVVWVSARKAVQEYGYEKISKRQARLDEQRLVILDGARVAVSRGGGADGDDGDGWNGDGREAVAATCPVIADLDLSRNLLEEFEGVVEVCAGLNELRSLKLSGNRFRSLIPGHFQEDARQAFARVTELGLAETLLTWPDICAVAAAFPALASLGAAANQFTQLPPTDFRSLAVTLTSLNIEYNDFTALSQFGCLAGLTSLQTLILKGNNISTTASGDGHEPVFHNTLHHVDLSYNCIANWSFIDALPTVFPGLSSLRVSHNPIYESNESAIGGMGALDEAFMITVGRLGRLTALNQGPVLASDRTNAEMFYLSRIARQLAATAEAAEPEVLAQHPRFQELCTIYGVPDVVRRAQTNPDFLEARLVNVMFRANSSAALSADDGYVKKQVAIPKTFDVYAVRAIAARLFGMSPLGTRLVWETGEWDPVGGFGSSFEDGDAGSDDGFKAETTKLESAESSAPGPGPEEGKWVRREVELREGPRQLGFCVDGLEASIRVERLEPAKDVALDRAAA